MRALVIAMLLPVLACNQPYNDDRETLVIEHWPEHRFPFGHWTLADVIRYDRDRFTLAALMEPRLVAIALGADRAEVARVMRPHVDWGFRDPDRMPVLEGPPRPLTAPELARLKVILGEPRFARPAKLCMPAPGVRLRFHRGDATADLLICTGCGQVEMSAPGGPLAMAGWPELGFQRPAMVGWLRGVDPDEAAFREPVDRY